MIVVLFGFTLDAAIR